MFSELLFLVAGLGVGSPVEGQEEASLQPEVQIRLKRTRLDQDEIRSGADFSLVVPEYAWRARFKDVEFWLLDCDGDGVLQPGAGDGLALAEGVFLVPLPEVWLTPVGQCRVRVEGDRLYLTPEGWEVEDEVLAVALRLNEMRLRAGLAPVRLDPKACEDSAAHLEYLRRNGLNNHGAQLASHEEKEGMPGYTPGGARAGREGLIGFEASLRESLEGWYATAFHAPPMLRPELQEIGLARGAGVSLLFPLPLPIERETPFLHPADQARDIPIEFSASGEIPNPAPGKAFGRGAGFPVFVWLPANLRDGELVSFRLHALDRKRRPTQELRGWASAPSAPASSTWPTNSGCAVFVPREPLEYGTDYLVRLMLEGFEEELRWTFRTVEEPRRRRR